MRGRLTLQGVAFVLVILFAFPLWAQNIRTESYQGFEVAAQEVLVKFQPEAQKSSTQVMVEFGRALDLETVEGVNGDGLLLIHSRAKDTASLIQELGGRPDVAFVEPNYIVRIADTIPNDPQFGELWGLQNTGQVIRGSAGTPGADISAYLAWDITTGSPANVVSVVDTGIDYNHPDLAANVWSAPTDFSVTIGGRTINCSAGSHGFNAITNTCNPMDDHSHGTHVSGTIGAVGNNGLGVAGVNWTASIMGLKFLTAQGSGNMADAIKAIEFALQTKAYFASDGSANVRVLSNSWGGPLGFSQALLDEILLANQSDMLFVAAAGNGLFGFPIDIDILPFYPASYRAPNVVAVAATTNRDALANFSNYGRNSVHLGAPGVDVLSTVRGGDYAYYSGTSMATPHVSGAAALVLSACALDTAGLKATLVENVDVIPALQGKTISGGRLNVYNAILACSSPAGN